MKLKCDIISIKLKILSFIIYISTFRLRLTRKSLTISSQTIHQQFFFSYLKLGLETILKAKSMSKMTLEREVLVQLIMARLENSQYADYHKSFDHKKEAIYHKCGKKRSKSHSYCCSSIKTLRVKLFSIINQNFYPKKGFRHQIKNEVICEMNIKIEIVYIE